MEDDIRMQQTRELLTSQIQTLNAEREKQGVKSSKRFVKNVMLLIVAQMLIKLLGLIYRIVIINIPGFGDIGNGYYSAGYEIYTVMLAVSSIGIPTVISKLVSERLAKGDKKGANRIFKVALYIFVTLGAILSILQYVFSDFIATHILQVSQASITLKVLAPAIVFVSFAAVIRGYFMGQEDIKPISFSQTFEQLLNAVLTVGLIYLFINKDTVTMAAAGNLASTLSIILAFIYIYIYYRRHRIKVAKNEISLEDSKSTMDIIKTILKLSIPITIGSLVSVLHSFIDTITVTNGIQSAFAYLNLDKLALEQKAIEMKGILSKVNTIVGLPQGLCIAISTTLVPVISGYISKKQTKEAEEMMQKSMTISMLLIMPAVVGLFVLAKPILQFLYPSASSGAGVMMLLAISTIFLCASFTVTGGLQGLRRCNYTIFKCVCRGSN